MEDLMRKSPLIPLFILLVGVSTSLSLAVVGGQSLHFYANAPSSGAGTPSDDMSVGLKAAGINPINSGPIDLTLNDPPNTVTTKAAKAICVAAFNSGLNCATNVFPPGTNCSTGASCCDIFNTLPTVATLSILCTASSGKGFLLSEGAGANNFGVAAQGPGGSISHLGVDSKNVYSDAGPDIAPRGLFQIRPNGITGTVQIKIFHTQGGASPRIANVTVDASNNDPGEALVLHNAIRTALQGISPALSPAIVATVHPIDDATYPLTAFGFFKQASNFVEITNIAAVGITEVEVIVPVGMGFSTEGSENVIDQGDASVPTLSGWGAMFAAAVLLAMIFLLHRKRMRMQQA
jgi:hypothetical protein